MPAITLNDEDKKLIALVNRELKQYIELMDFVKYAAELTSRVDYNLWCRQTLICFLRTPACLDHFCLAFSFICGIETVKIKRNLI